VEINISAFSFNNETQIFYKEIIENEFQKYAQENGLDISLKMTLLNYGTPTDSYESFVEKSLQNSNSNKNNNKNKYEIYFYDNKYTNMYGPYLTDLRDVISKELIEINDAKLLNETCTYNGQLIGIPMGVSYEVLYSNKELLNKHYKPTPKTWEELIDTCKYIMEQENDSDLICYNGLFDDTDAGLYSIYEFVYSGRNKVNSTYPGPEEKSFADSLKMLNRIKNEVSSNTIFSANENFTFNKLMNGKAIFLKYWLIGEPLLSQLPYYITLLPGLKRGVSGSMVGGSNIGIIKDLDNDKREATYEVFNFLISKYFKKRMFENGMAITSVPELLNDKELCKTTPCDLIKEIQFTGEPTFLEGVIENKKRYKKYIYEFLYKDQSLEDTIKKVNNILKVYYVSLDTENSYVGLIYFIVFALSISLMLLSLIFTFMKSFKEYFRFLPVDMWVITVIGCVIIFCQPLISYGPVSPVKCYLKILLISLGYTISVCPTLYKLVAQFPGQGKIPSWVNNNRYLFLLGNILIDLLLNSISLASPYSSVSVTVEDGESFKTCKFDNINLIIVFVYKFIVIFVFLYLIFVEWNITSTLYDVRLTVAAIYGNILTFILVYVFNFFEIKNYVYNYLIQSIITSLIAISNYTFLYGSRVLLRFIKTGNLYLELVSNSRILTSGTAIGGKINSTSLGKTDSNGNPLKSTRNSNFITRTMDYHYARESMISPVVT